MAHSGFLAFLLFIGLGASDVSGENITVLCESILNANLKNDSLSNFNLTVSPDKLSSNANYSVQLKGAGDFTVLFQAVIGSVSAGKWSTQNDSCDGSPLFINHSFSSQHIDTTWTSPVNVTSVTIKAYLQNKPNTFILHEILREDSSPDVNTTKAPSTSNHTEGTKATSKAPSTSNHTEGTKATSKVTTHHVAKTTSAASIEQSSLVSMALSLILGVLLIPNKYLS
ncbi:uncharacterized protein [Dendrobates tinctorius]|uniref:uncharacterized protein n=1 Tax=Dendrobates tinctorius TaxID=92724 RepID=UPI003CC9A137